MSKEIKFKSVGVHSGFKKSEMTCQGRVIHNKVLEMDEIAEDFARFANMDKNRAGYYAKYFVDYIVDAIGNGYRLNLGAFSLYLTMKGSINGANGQFDSSRNRLELNIDSKKQIEEALSRLEPVNVTMDGETLRITSVLDGVAKQEGVITIGANVCMAGQSFLIDTSRDDEGVWLETDGGEVVLRAKVQKSTRTTLDCIFRGDAAPGEYRIVVATRMGDASRPAPAVARRKVTLRSAR